MARSGAGALRPPGRARRPTRAARPDSRRRARRRRLVSRRVHAQPGYPSRLARAVVPDLPVVPMGVTLRHGPIDACLWDALIQRARAAIPDEVLLAIIAREPADGELFVAAAGPYTLVEPQLDETGTGDWQPQQASRCAVRATPIPDAVV